LRRDLPRPGERFDEWALRVSSSNAAWRRETVCVQTIFGWKVDLGGIPAASANPSEEVETAPWVSTCVAERSAADVEAMLRLAAPGGIRASRLGAMAAAALRRQGEMISSGIPRLEEVWPDRDAALDALASTGSGFWARGF
jgi:hypothetical protein